MRKNQKGGLPMISKLLTTSAAARRLEISESGVRLLEDRGELKAIRDSSGRRLFNADELEKFAEKRPRRTSTEGQAQRV